MTVESQEKELGIPELLKQCKTPSNVLLHLLFLRRNDPMKAEELWALQKGITKFSSSKVNAILAEFQRDRVARNEDGCWTIGPDFAPGEDPNAAAVAHRVLANHEKPRMTAKVKERQEQVLETLSRHGRSPVSAVDLFNQMEGRTHQTLRTLQRDLVELEKMGLVVRNDDGWMADPDAKDDRFEGRASAAALRLLMKCFADAVPMEIQAGLKSPIRRAMKKLDAMEPEDPRNRWLEAIRIVPGHHELDDPEIRADIKDAVEDAILQRTKIHLAGKEAVFLGVTREFSETGSISHYLLEMLARPAIVFWPEGTDEPRRIQIKDIASAEIVNKPAAWPRGYEPKLTQDGILFDSGDYASHGGESLFVLRVSDDALQRLNTKRLGKRLKIEGKDGPGWTIASFRARGTLPLYEYLKSLKGVVVLRPSMFWKFVQLDYRSALNQYNEAADLVRRYKEDEDLETSSARVRSDE